VLVWGGRPRPPPLILTLIFLNQPNWGCPILARSLRKSGNHGSTRLELLLVLHPSCVLCDTVRILNPAGGPLLPTYND
jgi:hypothetical protein